MHTRAVSPLLAKDAAGTPEVPAPVVNEGGRAMLPHNLIAGIGKETGTATDKYRDGDRDGRKESERQRHKKRERQREIPGRRQRQIQTKRERERENEKDKARATEKRKCRALHSPYLCGFFGS